MQRDRKLKPARVNGFALPTAVVFLVVFSLFGFLLVTHFGGVGGSQAVRAKLSDKQYASSMAAIRRVEYELKQNGHVWSPGSSQQMTFFINGTSVTVTREDINVP